MRTIIDLPEEQLRRLAELCGKKKISRAEAVRRAVAAMLEQNKASGNKKPLEAYFGMWKGRADMGDAVEYQRRLRAEWNDRDRGVKDRLSAPRKEK